MDRWVTRLYKNINRIALQIMQAVKLENNNSTLGAMYLEWVQVMVESFIRFNSYHAELCNDYTRYIHILNRNMDFTWLK